MKISLLAISVIIALQATTFIHGSNERYIYHHTLHESNTHTNNSYQHRSSIY